MAELIVTREALLHWADAQIGDLQTLTDCYLRLYSGELELSWYTTLEELEAVQATYEGYVPVQLVGWSDAIIIGVDGVTQADLAIFEATAASTDVIRGCYATSADGTRIWGAAAFAAPLAVPFGSELQIDTTFNLRSILGSP